MSRAFHLGGAEPVLAHYDAPPAEPKPVGILLCPLFGNDDLCAYRPRRDWAKRLAAAGHPSLRIDLPATGDSAGGPRDPGRVGAWAGALGEAAAWLRAQPGCARVVAIGIGLGGLLAVRAAADGAAIDDLVLWSVPARGRAFVRQTRVLAQLEASTETAGTDAADAALPEGALASAGFVLSAETIAELDALDLTKLALPHAARRRALLLERDGIDVDARLRGAFEQAGVAVTVAPGPGYGAMVTVPQRAQPPQEVFATVGAWLADAPAEPVAAPSPPAPPAELPALELTIDGVRVRETPIAIPHPDGELVGILAEPAGDGVARAPLTAVLLNAGALRRVGPGRMWVEAARRWAARGVPTVRMDLAGIGDADGDGNPLGEDEGFYVDRYVGQTHAVLATLAARGLPERFLLAGLCSGAYWSFHAAIEDPRVASACMVNPRALFWDWHLDGVRHARNVRKALRPQTWRKLAQGEISGERVRTIARGVGVAVASLPARVQARARHQRGGDELGDALDRLEASGAQLLAIFTAQEPLLEELEADGRLARMERRANVRVERIPGPLTSHTLEPLPLQRAVHRLLDAALDRRLAT